jgi:hypothetical protein
LRFSFLINYGRRLLFKTRRWTLGATGVWSVEADLQSEIRYPSLSIISYLFGEEVVATQLRILLEYAS